MTYYTIDIQDCSLNQHIRSVEELILYREAYLNITTVFWLVTGVEIDLDQDNCTYLEHTPVLVYLN